MTHSGEELGLGFKPTQLPLGDAALNNSLPLSYSHMVLSLHRLLWVLFPLAGVLSCPSSQFATPQFPLILQFQLKHHVVRETLRV